MKKMGKGVLEPRKVKWGYFVLGLLSLVIVGLLVSIIVIEVTRDKAEDEMAEVDSEIEEIRMQLIDDNVTSVEGVVEVCAEYLEDTNGSVRASLLTECAWQMMENDGEKQYYDRTIEYLSESDKILQSVNSAVNMINAGIYYNDETLVERYRGILEDRQAQEGLSGGEAI